MACIPLAGAAPDPGDRGSGEAELRGQSALCGDQASAVRPQAGTGPGITEQTSPLPELQDKPARPHVSDEETGSGRPGPSRITRACPSPSRTFSPPGLRSWEARRG